MSSNETHFGKLRKVDLQGKTKEEFFEWKCKEENLPMKEYSENWGDNYRYSTNNYDKYFTNGEIVWEVFDHVDMDDDDFIKILDNKDGTYSFITTFYNGGTCLGEILEEEIAKL